MNAGDLTTLEGVKAWLGAQPGTDDDALLAALITAASNCVSDHLGRAPIVVTQFTDIYDVYQPDYVVLRQWPVVSVASVAFANATITANAAATFPLGSGFLLEDTQGRRPHKLSVVGYSLPQGRAAVQVVYTAGYKVTDPAAVASGGQLTPQRTWLGDLGVAYASGTALTLVTGAPAVGQYAVSSVGVYTFNIGDAGPFLVSYSFPPAPVEQAVKEIVGEAYKRKDRIGQISKTQQGQGTVSFAQVAMNQTAALMLRPYMRVAPV